MLERESSREVLTVELQDIGSLTIEHISSFQLGLSSYNETVTVQTTPIILLDAIKDTTTNILVIAVQDFPSFRELATTSTSLEVQDSSGVINVLPLPSKTLQVSHETVTVSLMF